MRHAVAFVILLATAAVAWSDDLTISDGKVFKNPQIVQFAADGVVIKHDGGTNQVAWQELPAPLRQRYQAEARNRKAQEIEKLKQDLARAQAEAARLESEAGSDASSVAEREQTPALFVTPEKLPKPAAELPPLKGDDIVDVAELVLQFRADATAAGQRYRNKTIRVRGVVERFESKMFVRKYDVVFESPEKLARVLAKFDYLDNFKAVYPAQRGQKLVGRMSDNAEVTLMQVGDAIIFKGKCKGLHESEVVFSGCRLVR